jgi:formate hydrogenlyase subunit 3/multisubunit Na+/H+ antiporter MnhD subunit
MSSPTLLALLLVAPLAGSALALIGKLMPNRLLAGRLLSVAALAALPAAGGVLGALAPAVFAGTEVRYALGGWSEPVGISLSMDGFAWVSAVLIVSLSLVIGTAALSRRRYGSSFFFFLMLLVAGMVAVTVTGDVFTLFVAFEVVAMAAYVLIAYERSSTGLVAAFKYLILSTVGILFFLFGVFLIYRDLGTLSLAGIAERVRMAPDLRDSTAIHLAVAALCVGIGVRTAFIPFHTWLPEAHAYAPHPVSALLSAVLIKVSFFAMLRIRHVFAADYLNRLFVWTGAITALLAVINALSQTDAKRLLAYHSISQMGYVLAVVGMTGALSLTASFSHAVNHALFKSLLFLSVGTAVQITGSRNLFQMHGVARTSPLLAMTFFAGALSIAGLPPWNGYGSKALISQVMDGDPAYLLLWITGAATIASFIKLSRVFLPARRDAATGGGAPPQAVAERPDAFLLIPVVLLAAGCLAAGVFAHPFFSLLHRLLEGGPTPKLPVLYTGSKLLATAGAAALGVGLYLAVMSKPGKRFSSRVRAMAPDLRTVLLLFFVGLAVFAAVAVV